MKSSQILRLNPAARVALSVRGGTNQRHVFARLAPVLVIWLLGAVSGHCFWSPAGRGHDLTVSGAVSNKAASQGGCAAGQLARAAGLVPEADPFQLLTNYQDDETDMLYYGFRYYSASGGRWTSRDPLVEPGFGLIASVDPTEDKGGPNLYGFVNNSSPNNTDSLGLEIFPGGVPPPAPAPASECIRGCAAKYILGIEIDTTIIVAGQPVLKKRFVTPGSAEGTSIAGRMTDAILGDAQLPARLPTLTRCCKLTFTKSASRFVSRWIPVVGWAMLTYDLSGLAGCICGCEGI